MNDPIEQLERDFAERHRWLQDAACRLIARGILSAEDISELTVLCKAEARILQNEGQPVPEFQRMPPGGFRLADSGANVRLESVGSLKGVNALAPKKPLEFSDQPLCVVFGNNGSGKSGYVRVLKQLCGCRGAVLPYGNVFDDKPTEPSCEVRYTLDRASKSAICRLKSGAVAFSR